MADFGSPVAAGINPNQGIQTLSGLLNIRKQQQDLQTGQYEQQSAKARSTIETQSATETQGLAQVMKDPIGAGIIDKDGNPTTNGLSIIQKVAPTKGADAYGKLVGAARSQIEFKTALNNLNVSERGEAANQVAGVAAGAKSIDEIQAGMDSMNAAKKGTPMEGDYQKMTAAMMDFVNKGGHPLSDPAPVPFEAKRQAALGMARGMLGSAGVVGAGGIGTPQAGTMDTGGQIQPGTVAPAIQGGAFTPSGAPVTKTTAPAILQMPSGSLAAAGGQYGVPSSAAPPQQQTKLQPLQRPSPNAPRADQENYTKQIAAAGEHQSAISAAANDPMNGVQATRFRNQQILDLIPHANTGPYLKILNTLASRLPGSSGDAYQDIEHYTAQNSAALAKTMGVPGTNLGAETAAAAAGNVERNPGALAEITKTNDALNTALSLYNKGLAKVTNNGSDPSKVNSYRQAFGQNLDINAVRWADAHRRKDETEIRQLQDKYGKDGVAGFTKSLKVLKSLSENGDLP